MLSNRRCQAAVIAVVLLGTLGASCRGSDPGRDATPRSPSSTTDQSAPTSPGRSQKTVAVRVVPVGSSGTLDERYHVLAVKDPASCPSPSELVFFAFSCTAGDFIFDPCWDTRRLEPTVVCMSAPWSDEVYRLRLERPISVKPLEGVDDSPWGIGLKSGLRCRLARGAHSTVGSAVVDYYCGEDEALVLLRGTIDRSSARWTAGAAARTDGGYERVSDQTITTVWFGS